VAVVLAVAAVSCWSIYPPGQTITLGLDLKGGLQVVMRVQTDDALRLRTQNAAERLRAALVSDGIPLTSIEAASATEFIARGVPDGAAFRTAAAALEPDFGVQASGGAFTFRFRPDVERRVREDTVDQALRTVERRVNELGVAEPVVARYTGADRLLVQLPGVPDPERAKRIIRTTAQLRLTLVEQGPFPTRDAALQSTGPQASGLNVLPERTGATPESRRYYVVRASPAVAGTDVRSARQSIDEFNRPAVAFTLTPDAAERFGRFTEQHVGRGLATVVDGRVISVATILGRIDGEGQIVGLGREELMEQVIALNAGALPADLEFIEETTVGASLGRESVRAGVLASLGGLALVALFMLAYYQLMGVNALVSIALNLLILLAFVAYIPVTLTLPGIAGLILTIGMGVDSNVLIFERIREERAAGRTARAAVHAGFDRVWITIIDTHVASLIAAACLYQFGTSSIRGFATTLTIGLLANVFTAVFVSKTLFELVVYARSARRRRGTVEGEDGARPPG
jgi:preprotein translocase subunit SecD